MSIQARREIICKSIIANVYVSGRGGRGGRKLDASRPRCYIAVFAAGLQGASV
jgi:hypothetical protein